MQNTQGEEVGQHRSEDHQQAHSEEGAFTLLASALGIESDHDQSNATDKGAQGDGRLGDPTEDGTIHAFSALAVLQLIVIANVSNHGLLHCSDGDPVEGSENRIDHDPLN